MDVFEALLTRRTIKDFTGEAVSREDLRKLLEVAIWAPNHRMTEPWRFAVVTREGIAGLQSAVLEGIRPDDPPKVHAKRAQLEKRLPGLGAFISVHRCPVPGDEILDREDYAACCCAVQNILVGARALGFASYWSTARLFGREPVRRYLKISPEQEIVASIWLGRAAREATSRRTPVENVSRWIEGTGER
jgi:nitroreductase